MIARSIREAIADFTADSDRFIKENDPTFCCTPQQLDRMADADVIRTLVAAIATYGLPVIQHCDTPQLVRIAYTEEVTPIVMAAARNYRRMRILDDDISAPPELTDLMWRSFRPERRLIVLLGVPTRLYIRLLRNMSPEKAQAVIVSIFDALRNCLLGYGYGGEREEGND